MTDEREFLGLRRDEVRLVPHDPRWNSFFFEVEALLHKILGPNARAIWHVGSTAVSGIAAKPILDVAVALNDVDMLNVRGMAEAGYTDCGDGGVEGRRYFVKRYDGETVSTQHIHMYAHDSKLLRDQIAFCRALQADPALAKDYETLKLSLFERDPKDRSGYTEAKTSFVLRVLSMTENSKDV